MIHPTTVVSDQANRKFPLRNMMVPLSTPYTDHKPSKSTPPNFKCSKKNALTTWHTLYSHYAHADQVIRTVLFIYYFSPIKIFNSMIGYLSNSWAVVYLTCLIFTVSFRCHLKTQYFNDLVDWCKKDTCTLYRMAADRTKCNHLWDMSWTPMGSEPI